MLRTRSSAGGLRLALAGLYIVGTGCDWGAPGFRDRSEESAFTPPSTDEGAGDSVNPSLETAAFETDGNYTGTCEAALLMSDAREAELKALIDTVLPGIGNELDNELAAGRTYSLYNAQIFTANLLPIAEYRREPDLMRALAQTYGRAFDHIQELDQAIFYYAQNAEGVQVRRQQLPLPSPAFMWTENPREGETVGEEVPLSSAQFLYAVTRLSRMIGQMGRDVPVDLSAFRQRGAEIAWDHYRRWLFRQGDAPGHFQTRGWGCDDGTFDHHEVVVGQFNRSFGTRQLVSYCNAVRDTDLWIIAGVVEFLQGHAWRGDGIELSRDDEAALLAYLADAYTLVESRMDSTPTGIVFDQGAWDEHPGYRYAGYTGDAFPGWVSADNMVSAVDPVPSTGLGWDISHARRFVAVFDTLHRFRSLVGSSFPSRSDLAGLADQLYGGIWNGDLENPRFANYWDGTNGWYRVNYSNRPEFGYPPFGLSAEALAGGFAHWSYLVPGLGDVFEAQYTLLSGEGAFGSNAKRALQALSSLAPYSLDHDWCSWSTRSQGGTATPRDPDDDAPVAPRSGSTRNRR